jgi:hypothetical protein
MLNVDMLNFELLRLRWGWMRRWLVVAIVVLGTAGLLRADSPWIYGIHWYGDPNGSVVESMSGGKGIWTLETVLPQSDPWWQASGQLWKFQQIVARGHTIICRLEPNWGKAIPLPGEDFNAYLADVQATAQLLSDVVHVWQIGNEMNLYAEWGGNELDAATYIAAFKQIRATIKGVTSSLGEQIVLVGPVSPGGVAGGVRHTAGGVYISQMCSALTDGDFDGFALHAYGAPWLNQADARADLQSGYTSQLSVIDSAGFPHKPVYITEWNRRVDPISDANEQQSAQFLHGAFTDLHNWNNTPGAHPIVCACWFIYANDPGWSNYSIAYLRGVGPSGQNNDLWDAMQYACTLNYPAVYPSANPPDTPMVDAFPPGTNIAGEALTVTTSSDFDANNAGAYAIDGVTAADSKWTSTNTSPPHWLALDFGTARNLCGMVVRHAETGGEFPFFNTSAFQLETADDGGGPWTMQAQVANPAQAPVSTRTFRGTTPTRHVRLFITDPGIDNYARIPEFEVYAALPGDADCDGTVDRGDLAVLVDCLGGPGALSPGDPCDANRFFVFDMDRDGDVDLHDYQALQTAVTP